jgi:hypothetical protein
MPAAPNLITQEIEQLVAVGKVSEALQRLQTVVAARPDAYRDVLALQNRLHTLNRQITQGVIDREDESLERARIVQGVLRVAEEAAVIPVADTASDRRPQKPWSLPSWAPWGLGLALLALLIWWLLPRDLAPAPPRPAVSNGFDLIVMLERVPTEPEVPIADGNLQLTIGDLRLPAKSWQLDRPLRYPALEAAYLKDTLTLGTSGSVYEYELNIAEDRTAEQQRSVRLLLEPRLENYSGTVVFPDGSPADGAELIFDDRFRTTADAQGRYALRLPVSREKTLQLQIDRQGKTLRPPRRISQDKRVLGTLKVPFPAS